MSRFSADPGVRGVHVVVPARDEAVRLPACLAALAAAVRRLHHECPEVVATVSVVLDGCVDGSAEVVAGHAWVEAVEVDLGVVGAVRAAGVRRAPRSGVSAAQVWVACTDADSVVPEDWLVEHVTLAARGHDLVVGGVHPDPDEVGHRRLALWRDRHHHGDGHPHVHGANLGFRLSAYDAVGGFAALATGEDHDLVERMRAAGVRWCATAAGPVLTSGRDVGRAPAGFAAYLLALGPL